MHTITHAGAPAPNEWPVRDAPQWKLNARERRRRAEPELSALERKPRHDLGAATGILYGCAFGVVIWAILYIVWMLIR